MVEKGQCQLVPGGGMDEDDKSVVSGSDAGTEYTHQDMVPDNESKDNLLIVCVGTHGVVIPGCQSSNAIWKLGTALA